MSLIPELIFRTVISRGFRNARNDNRFLDQLFRSIDQKSVAQIRKFIQEQQIYVDINYPREELKLPAIIILLKAESEGHAYLADSMGLDELPDHMSYDDADEELETLGGAASVSSLSGEGPIIFGPYTALSSTNNTLTVSSKIWNIDQFKVMGPNTIHIIQGKGVGQQRTVTANSQNTLMTSPNWRANPDTTSVFVIKGPATEIVGEPRSLYKRSEGPLIERKGFLDNKTYQIQIIAQNPELVIYLHAILKSIFILARTYFESQGIINLKMGATDFTPKTEYEPDNAYMRAMSIEFMCPFDVFAALENVATSVRVALESEDGVAAGSTNTLSDTTTT